MYEFTTAYPNGLPDERSGGSAGGWGYKKPWKPTVHVSPIDSAFEKQRRIDSAMYPVKRLFKDFILNA